MEQTKPFLAGSPAHYISKRSTGGTTTKAALSIAEVVRLGGAVIRQKIISIIYCFRSGFNFADGFDESHVSGELGGTGRID